MIRRLSLPCLLAAALVSCQSPYKKADAEDRKPLKDQAGEQAFQGFIGRLRIAVGKRDQAMLSSMMAPDFGYRWDEPQPGETVFSFWDAQNLWPELQTILKERFVPNDLYMTAPPKVVTDPTYQGYRAGARLINGGWKFAYFVPGNAQPQ